MSERQPNSHDFSILKQLNMRFYLKIDKVHTQRVLVQNIFANTETLYLTLI